MRYLWTLGYYVRKNVPLTETWDRSEHTDIDVLGVKVDEEFDSAFVVCDCKSGASNSTKTRLFWLSGVMKYFGAPRGIFVRSQVLGTKYIELANSLGISPLSEGQLIELEKAYGVDPNNLVGPFNKEQAKGETVLMELKEHNKPLYDYLRVKYWEDPPHQQILSLFSKAKKLNEASEDGRDSSNFHLAYILSLLSLSVLRLSRGILTVNPPQREEVASLSLLGGRIGYLERTELLEGFYDFMTQELQTRYRAKYPVSKKEFVENVVPTFSKYLADLMVRLCQNPRVAKALPRAMEHLAYDVILSGQSSGLKVIQTEYPGTSKEQIVNTVKDYWAFVERSGLANPYIAHAMDKAIAELDS